MPLASALFPSDVTLHAIRCLVGGNKQTVHAYRSSLESIWQSPAVSLTPTDADGLRGEELRSGNGGRQATWRSIMFMDYDFDARKCFLRLISQPGSLLTYGDPCLEVDCMYKQTQFPICSLHPIKQGRTTTSCEDGMYLGRPHHATLQYLSSLHILRYHLTHLENCLISVNLKIDA